MNDSVNIFEILKVTDLEATHSNMLAWLLNPEGSHNLGQKFFELMINWLADEYVLSTDERNELLGCNYSSLSIQREFPIHRKRKKKPKNYIDILIESPEAETIIVIENKIYSSEGDNQLSEYKKAIMEKYPDYRQYYLYLTPKGNMSTDPKVWRSIGYNKIIEWIELLLRTPPENCEVEQIIKQYLTSLENMTQDFTVRNEWISCVGEWSKEWADKGYSIVPQEGKRSRNKNMQFIFRTPALDEITQLINDYEWYCEYFIASADGNAFPHLLKYHVTFENLEKDKKEKFKDKLCEIKSILKTRSWKITPTIDNYKPENKYHIFLKWKLDIKPTDNFSAIADDVKIELERIIFEAIPEFEAKMREIIQLQLPDKCY